MFHASEASIEEVCSSVQSFLVSNTHGYTYRRLAMDDRLCSRQGQRITQWPERTNVRCWHDTCKFTWQPICLVEEFKKSKQMYVVNGNFCSVQCAVAYISDTYKVDRWVKIMLLHNMLSKVFNINTTLTTTQAPPKNALTKFGGLLTIEEFRDSFTKAEVRILEPPFIMHTLLMQSKDTVLPAVDTRPTIAEPPRACSIQCSETFSKTTEARAEYCADEVCELERFVCSETGGSLIEQASLPAIETKEKKTTRKNVLKSKPQPQLTNPMELEKESLDGKTMTLNKLKVIRKKQMENKTQGDLAKFIN